MTTPLTWCTHTLVEAVGSVAVWQWQLPAEQDHHTHLQFLTVFGLLLRGLFNKVRDENFQCGSGYKKKKSEVRAWAQRKTRHAVQPAGSYMLAPTRSQSSNSTLKGRLGGIKNVRILKPGQWDGGSFVYQLYQGRKSYLCFHQIVAHIKMAWRTWTQGGLTADCYRHPNHNTWTAATMNIDGQFWATLEEACIRQNEGDTHMNRPYLLQ